MADKYNNYDKMDHTERIRRARDTFSQCAAAAAANAAARGPTRMPRRATRFERLMAETEEYEDLPPPPPELLEHSQQEAGNCLYVFSWTRQYY